MRLSAGTINTQCYKILGNSWLPQSPFRIKVNRGRIPVFPPGFQLYCFSMNARRFITGFRSWPIFLCVILALGLAPKISAAQDSQVTVLPNRFYVPTVIAHNPSAPGGQYGRPVQFNDSEIQRKIQKQLAADPQLNPDQIVVSVRNGIATLTGSVPNWTARNSAARDARSAGAFSVLNRLAVR